MNYHTERTPIRDAGRAVGGLSALARLLGVAPPTVSQWASGVRPIPAERCPEIERATGGVVICEELRPDVDWQVIRANPRPKPKTRESPVEAIARLV